jgi:ankyrin repeat protein
MEGFVKAILQGDFKNITTSMESLDVILSINNELKNEIRINNKLIDGTTPLYLACKVGNLKIVEYLLKNGAKISINTPTKNGNTCLMVAVAHNNIDLVKVLLKYGADPNVARPSDGTIPIMIAAYNGYSKIVGILIPKTNLLQKDIDGNTTSDIVKTRITQIEEGIEPIDNAEHVIAKLKNILIDLDPADDFIGTVFDTTFGKTGVGKSRISKSGGKQRMTIRKRVKRMSKTRNRK